MQCTLLYIVPIENSLNFNVISAWCNTVCCMYRNLFETCRGQFNWTKLITKSVNLVALSHVYHSMLSATYL